MLRNKKTGSHFHLTAKYNTFPNEQIILPNGQHRIYLCSLCEFHTLKEEKQYK